MVKHVSRSNTFAAKTAIKWKFAMIQTLLYYFFDWLTIFDDFLCKNLRLLLNL
jgi:hypothetical protein